MNHRRIWLHFAFWLAYWLVFAYTYSRYDGHFAKYATTEGLEMPVRMLATYAAFWCVGRMQYSALAFGGVALAVFCGGLLNRALKMLYIVPVWFPDATFEFWSFRMMYDVSDCALAAGAALTARLYFRQQDLLRREEALRSEKLAAELSALKAQLHPHFLFNTINNLYALARTQSNKTAPVALQLAHLLRYVLYESQQPAVPLEKEIKLLRDYVALEKLRFDDDRLHLEMQVDVDDPTQHIAPLLLLPLVENAFKHGAGEQREAAWVKVFISLKDKVLELRVENSKSAGPPIGQPGIGLKNLRRQLELLYAGQHDLDLTDDDDTYTARLRLQLAKLPHTTTMGHG